jgi:hypothetical protein
VSSGPPSQRIWKRRLYNHAVASVPTLLAILVYVQNALRQHERVDWNVLWALAIGGVIAEVRTLTSAKDVQAEAVTK